MSKLKLSSGMNLHAGSRADVPSYVRAGIAMLKNHGFEAADFSMRLLDFMGEDWQQIITDARAVGETAGVRFEVCHLPFGVKVDGTAEEVARFNGKMHRAIDAAVLLGVDHAVLHPNTKTVPESDYNPAAQYDSVMEHLAPFAEHAARVGLSLAVENMRIVPTSQPVRRYCGTPEELCTVADALGIGVCWDFGHAHINGLTQSEALACVGKRLRVIHVNDNFAWGDDHVPPFCGKIDWRDAMQGLSAIGFTGLFNYEIAADRVPAAAKDSFAQYLADAAGVLREMME